MKRQLLTLILSCFSVGLIACTCPQIKGLDGKFAGLATMDSLLNHTFLVEVTDKTLKGVTVQIKSDYKNSTNLTDLFIENMDPSYTCSHSTDKFKVGEKYLIVCWSDERLEKKISLSTCFESYINVTENQTKAQVINQKVPQTSIWTVEQLEQKLDLKIRN